MTVRTVPCDTGSCGERSTNPGYSEVLKLSHPEVFICSQLLDVVICNSV